MKVLLSDSKQGLTVRVSDEDYDRALQANYEGIWRFSKKGGRFYIVRFSSLIRREQSLGQFILNTWRGRVRYLDGDPTNCQRENLKRI